MNSIKKELMVELYIKARKYGLTKANIEAGWRKSGIYPSNIDIPLTSKFVKEAADRERPVLKHATEIRLITAQSLVNLDAREARFQARDMAQQLAAKDAEIAILKAQLIQANKKVDSAKSTQKRKRVANEDSNEKLISVKAILGMQELAEKEQAEENARKQRKLKRAENTLKKAQNTLHNL